MKVNKRWLAQEVITTINKQPERIPDIYDALYKLHSQRCLPLELRVFTKTKDTESLNAVARLMLDA